MFSLGILLHEDLVHVGNQLLVLDHAYNPRLAVHAAGGIDAGAHHGHQFIVLHGLVQVLAYRAPCHDVVDDLVFIHSLGCHAQHSDDCHKTENNFYQSNFLKKKQKNT